MKQLRSFFVLCLVFLLGWVPKALAYPNHIAFSYSACATCHQAPTGGGKVNRYGKSFLTPMVRDPLKILEYVRGPEPEDFETSKPVWEVGGQVRLLGLRKELPYGEPAKNQVIPMLSEVNFWFSKNTLSLYGALSVKEKELSQGALKDPKDKEFESYWRELWLLWQGVPSLSVKLGQTMIPFGLKTPDHTRLTRVLMNFDKYHQILGLELSHHSRSFLSTVFFYPEEFKNLRKQQGSVFSFEFYPFRATALGLSYLKDQRAGVFRDGRSFFFRVMPQSSTYLLGQWDLLQEKDNSKVEPINKKGQVVFFKGGLFPKEWWELWVEASQKTFSELTKEKLYRLGVASRVTSWLRLEVFMDQYYEEDKKGRTYYAWQAHAHL